MTQNLKQQYKKLLSSCVQFLRQEYEKEVFTHADKETFEYFRSIALERHRPKILTSTANPKFNVATNQLTPTAQKKETISKNQAQPSFLSENSKKEKESKSTSQLYADDKKKISNPSATLIKEAKNEAFQKKTSPETTKTTSFFSLEPPNIHVEADFSDIEDFMRKTFPNVTLKSSSPCDEGAKKISNRWKVSHEIQNILIFSFGETSKEKIFLSNLAHAISWNLAPATLFSVEKAEFDNSWQAVFQHHQLKMIIARNEKIESFPHLMKFYHEGGDRKLPTFGKIPLFLLSDLSLYLQEPSLKRKLWNGLRNAIPPSLPPMLHKTL